MERLDELQKIYKIIKKIFINFNLQMILEVNREIIFYYIMLPEYSLNISNKKFKTAEGKSINMCYDGIKYQKLSDLYKRYVYYLNSNFINFNICNVKPVKKYIRQIMIHGYVYNTDVIELYYQDDHNKIEIFWKLADDTCFGNTDTFASYHIIINSKIIVKKKYLDPSKI